MGFFRREFDPLSFAKEFKDGAADRAAVEEMLDSTLVSDEPEALVDEESCDCPGWHKPEALPFRTPRDIPRELSRLRAPAEPKYVLSGR